jgi:hypothetical protein
MSRYRGGDKVDAGFYFNLDSWQVATLSGEGGVLPGGKDAVFLRVPLPVLLAAAPMMGAAFAIFLPFIGLALVADYAVKKTWAAGREALHASATALGPQTRTGEAYFTGHADKKDEKPMDAELEAKLDKLERAIEDHEAKTGKK